MELNEDEVAAVSFAYSHVYDAFKELKRKRSMSEKEKEIRVSAYKNRLKTLQQIITDKLGMDCTFASLD